MKFSIAWILLAAPALWAADAVPMNVKTGQWEMTITRQVSGVAAPSRPMPQIPADKLAQLPPEQRAQVEAMLARAAGGAAPSTTTTKTCVTKESLSQIQTDDSSRPNCKNTVLSSSAAKQVIRTECQIAGALRITTTTFEATGPDSMKFTIVSNPADASKSADSNPAAAAAVNISGTSKWLGPVCTDAK
jgi:hypothetical protein